MADEIKDFLRQISILEQKLALFENDPIKRGYFSLSRIINQQVNFLNKFKLDEEISKSPKEDATYARTTDLWSNLPKLISALSELRVILKIKGDDEDIDAIKKQNSITTPESMAYVLGNTAGQQD